MTNYDTLKEYEAHKKPVPSYELWKAVHEQWKVAVKENAQLKELLKTIKDYLPEYEIPMDILAKIDEVLR